jgi:hypothetical protein
MSNSQADGIAVSARGRRCCLLEGDEMAESRLADRPAGFWEAVEIDYRGKKLSLSQLRDRHHLTEDEFDEARRELGWKHRDTSRVNRKQIIRRLFVLLDRMLINLESEMKNVGEQEVNILGRLVQSMGKLIEIEAVTGKAVTPRETRDMHDIRSKLIARIDELKRN